MGFENNVDHDIYNKLTEPKNNWSSNNKWTLYLVLCCLSVTSASFQFGYNIGALNSPTKVLKEFIKNEMFIFENVNVSSFNTSADLTKLEKEARTNDIWTIINCLFVVGGMLGAFSSKNVLDIFGRKKGILFHNLFSISASILVLISYFAKSPVCLIISRLLFGVQGGMSCSLIPTYLSEISPSALRGQTGVIHQLCLTIGILVAQILGFKQILGSGDNWQFLLAIPLIPSVLGSLSLMLFFPETPKALIIKNKDTDGAQRALQKLRNRVNVNGDLQEIYTESNNTGQTDQSVSILQLFQISELRWPLFASLVLQVSQQLCGINAIFFYSNGIFKDAGISEDLIQYAVFSTGLINVISTIICVPLIDRLGRKPLLVFPMIIIVVDFILLIVFMSLQNPEQKIYSYLSIVCIMVFIICFALGLGPIPFVFVAESFRQDARGAALALCMFTNWLANLILTLAFPYLAKILKEKVFVIFTVIVLITVIIIIKKVPETKGRKVDDIIDEMNGRKRNVENKNDILMANVQV